MKVRYDRKLLPQDGERSKFALIFVQDCTTEDVLTEIAERWRPHFSHTLFALPVISGSEHSVDSDGSSFDDKSGVPQNTLAAYVNELVTAWSIPQSQIVVIAFGSQVPSVATYALAECSRVAAIVGFSSTAFEISACSTAVGRKPPMMLVHGQLDPVTDARSFLSTLQSLEKSGVSVVSCFRPAVGRAVDGYGADAAMFFVKGVLSSIEAQPRTDEAASFEMKDPIKLVIWDLDETLWSGTLDEQPETVILNASRVDIIRQLNRNGVVSAICSKNKYEVAKQQLQAFGIWDEFVFPRISFDPKGQVIKTMIEQMQLRPQNCLFIDDNVMNLSEAKSILPSLSVLDAKSDECDNVLRQIVETTRNTGKSRVAEYRSLEQRSKEAQLHDGNRDTFLHSCEINVAFANSSDLIDFTGRIEDLINRSNQLNYLKTRVSPGSLIDFVSEPSLREGFAVFAWDRFGYHGLVGFIGIDVRTEKILHFALSCRIMHMGIENALLHRARKRFGNLQVPTAIGLDASLPSWITVNDFSHQIRQKITAGESSIAQGAEAPEIRIMANCQSGIFTHYSGLREIAEVDSHPRIFVMSMLLSKDFHQQSFHNFVVHYPGSDLFDIFWPEQSRSLLEQGLYYHLCEQFCSFLNEKGSELLIIGLHGDVPVDVGHVIRGVTSERILLFNEIWRALAAKYSHVTFLEVRKFVEPGRMADCVHFRSEASRDIGERIRHWYLSKKNENFNRNVA